MKRLVLAVVLAVAVAVFGSVPSIGIVAGPDNEAPYSSHVDPLGEGGSYVPKADGPDNYPNYEKTCLDIENIILAYDPLGEGGSLVPKADGPGEGGSYVPKVVCVPVGEGGSYVPKYVDAGPGEGGSYVPKYVDAGPGEGGSYVPKVAMAETDDSNSNSSDNSSGGGGIVGSISG